MCAASVNDELDVELERIVDSFDAKVCRKCDDILLIDINWSEALKKSWNYVCLPCKRLKDESIRRTKGAKKREKKDLSIIKANKKKYGLQYWKDNPDIRAFHTYKNNAKKREIGFHILFEEFMMFWQQPCAYCHDDIKTIGIDRINNSIGYEVDNLVSCCTKCNWMKSDLSVDGFIEHCKKIIRSI